MILELSFKENQREGLHTRLGLLEPITHYTNYIKQRLT